VQRRRFTSCVYCLAFLCSAWAVRGQQPVSQERIAGPTIPVPAEYFGMHVHRPLTTTPWPTVPFADLRLWDTMTTWRELENQHKGDWRFADLDRMVDLAEQHHVNILYTFGKTPKWTSSIAPGGSFPTETGAPKSMSDWRDFVRKVAERYRGRIQAYELWNEPSYHGFYNGDIRTMAQMSQEAAGIIHQVDPKAIVVSPSPTTPESLGWFKEFLADGGAQHADVIGYHLYVTPKAPEQIVPFVAQINPP